MIRARQSTRHHRVFSLVELLAALGVIAGLTQGVAPSTLPVEIDEVSFRPGARRPVVSPSP